MGFIQSVLRHFLGIFWEFEPKLPSEPATEVNIFWLPQLYSFCRGVGEGGAGGAVAAPPPPHF